MLHKRKARLVQQKTLGIEPVEMLAPGVILCSLRRTEEGLALPAAWGDFHEKANAFA